jgi:quercetin dioxygenase-like cupin family protein
MDQASFEASLAADGYVEASRRSIEPNKITPKHNHLFDVRALVIEGEITLTVEGASTEYIAGQVFTMDRGCEHAESVGPEGVTYVVGRRTT